MFKALSSPGGAGGGGGGKPQLLFLRPLIRKTDFPVFHQAGKCCLLWEIWKRSLVGGQASLILREVPSQVSCLFVSETKKVFEKEAKMGTQCSSYNWPRG